MIKHLFSIPMALLACVACSTTPDTTMLASQSNETTKVSQNKPHKRRQKTLQEGVISVDISSYNNRLHLLTGKYLQGKRTLWYQYSDDSGVSWSTASEVLNDDNLPVKMARGKDAQITAQGNIIIVSWTKFDETARFNAGPMLTARSTDNGQNWQYTASPPDWKKGSHGYIDLAADKQAIHAVWLDSRTTRSGVKASQGLRYARSTDGGLSWQPNLSLDNISCSCCWNTINTDGNGNAYVLYRDKQPSDLSIGIIDSKQHWQWLNHVGAFDWQFDGCPHIGGGFDFQNTQGKKRMHAIIGTGHPEHLGVHYLYSDNAGKNWSSPLLLGNESAIHADIAAHDNGRVLAVWDMMSENGLAVFAAESSNRGESWSKPRQLSKVGMRATHPIIVKTEKGFLAAWTESNGQQQTLAKIIL